MSSRSWIGGPTGVLILHHPDARSRRPPLCSSPTWPPETQKSVRAVTSLAFTPSACSAPRGRWRSRATARRRWPPPPRSACRAPRGLSYGRSLRAHPGARPRGREMRMPTGVRTPVVTMSIRARTGAVQALLQPGRRALTVQPLHQLGRGGRAVLSLQAPRSDGQQPEPSATTTAPPRWRPASPPGPQPERGSPPSRAEQGSVAVS